MTDPAQRMQTIRDHITAQRAKLPPHSANGHHDGGPGRYHVDAEPEPQELGYVDTSSRSYSADGRGDQPHETVDYHHATTTGPEAEHQPPPTPRGRVPKPDPFQGGGTGGYGDSPEIAIRDGRTRDALAMINDHLRHNILRRTA